MFVPSTNFFVLLTILFFMSELKLTSSSHIHCPCHSQSFHGSSSLSFTLSMLFFFFHSRISFPSSLEPSLYVFFCLQGLLYSASFCLLTPYLIPFHHNFIPLHTSLSHLFLTFPIYDVLNSFIITFSFRYITFLCILCTFTLNLSACTVKMETGPSSFILPWRM